MTATAYRTGLPVPPWNMRRLPIDERGYPTPWFVQWFLADGTASEPGIGKPDFRIADSYKREAAVKHKLCWVCGKKLGNRFAFVIGPMCAVNRVAGDPPAHTACAIYSATVCPFLARPKAERREAGKPAAAADAEIPGLGLMRNPGVALVWITDKYDVVPDQKGGFILHIGHPRGTMWFAEGRQATRAEVLASIESGLPLLQQMAKEESPDAEAQLAAQATRALELVPRA
jgi:hypothetical protein